MKLSTVPVFLLALGGCCAHAQPPSSVFAALGEEMERNRSGLRLPGAAEIHHLRFHVSDVHTQYAAASLGALIQRDVRPTRRLGVAVRVGTHEMDNTGFGGWETGTGARPLAVGRSARADRQAAWLLVDEAYKEAVEQYARKVAVFTPPPDHPGDFQLLPPTVFDGGETARPDADALEARIVALSAVLATVPGLEVGRAVLGAEAGFDWIADTAGTRVRRPWAEVSIAAVAKVRADDGMLLADRLLWSVREAGQLPPEPAMQAEARHMAEELAAAASAPRLEEEYVGPVVFEQGAAIELFRHLLVPQLEGTPPVLPFETFLDAHSPRSGTRAAALVRLRRRVLPPGWKVADDPLRAVAHPASFTHDAEGTPARRVELVEDGIVRALLMCRTPRKNTPGTNGHARGGPGARLTGRAALTWVEPATRVTREALRARALELARSYGQDHVLVVRRLVDDAFLPPDAIGNDNQTLALPPPVAFVRLHADGREERLRGAAFAGVHRWVLRDLAAAGPQVEGTYMAPHVPGGRRGGVIIGLPTWLSAPEVLVGEMELVPVPPDPREKPVVPQPPTSTPG